VAQVPRKVYEAELRRLQAELVVLQEWVKTSGARLVVIFEGRVHRPGHSTHSAPCSGTFV
jgi:polyphosphate kinase 2 (PPK2 family)